MDQQMKDLIIIKKQREEAAKRREILRQK